MKDTTMKGLFLRMSLMMKSHYRHCHDHDLGSLPRAFARTRQSVLIINHKLEWEAIVKVERRVFPSATKGYHIVEASLTSLSLQTGTNSEFGRSGNRQNKKLKFLTASAPDCVEKVRPHTFPSFPDFPIFWGI
ncbi:hypothetical protein LINPERPRIM_LOCUS23827 [Linum perenne]